MAKNLRQKENFNIKLQPTTNNQIKIKNYAYQKNHSLSGH
jgi:hypothetical protein